jgi:hypothetical protein
MFDLPQEIEVWYVIPAIRKELAKALVEKHGLTFEKAGEALGVTKSAVSQYIHKKRANETKFPAFMKKEFESSAELISQKPNSALAQIMGLLSIFKKCGCSCSICKKHNKGAAKQCAGSVCGQ